MQAEKDQSDFQHQDRNADSEDGPWQPECQRHQVKSGFERLDWQRCEQKWRREPSTIAEASEDEIESAFFELQVGVVELESATNSAKNANDSEEQRNAVHELGNVQDSINN